MQRRPNLADLAILGLLGAVAGCTPDRFLNSLPPTQEQVDRVTSDRDLSSQQKREELQIMGLPPDVINAVLVDDREGNQFGGDLRSAYDRVATGRFSELTPDEIQIYGDAASDVDEALDIGLSDAEAQAIADVFEANEINTADQLNAFLADAGNAVPGAIPDGVLRELFIDFDPDTLIPELP